MLETMTVPESRVNVFKMEYGVLVWEENRWMLREDRMKALKDLDFTLETKVRVGADADSEGRGQRAQFERCYSNENCQSGCSWC